MAAPTKKGQDDPSLNGLVGLPRVDQALWLIEQGLTLVRVRPRSKKPDASFGEEWPRTNDPSEVRSWFTTEPTINVGVLCSPEVGLVMVDVDEYDDPERALTDRDLPETLTVKGNGLRLLYRTDGRPTITGVPGRKIQVLGNNFYGVVPPSVHPGDPKKKKKQPPFPYEWWRIAPIAPAPSWLYATAAASTSPERPSEGRKRALSPMEVAQQRTMAKELLRAVQAKGPWEQRHRRDFAFAIACHRRGIDEGIWAEAVLTIANSKAREGGPRQSEDYLTRTWERAGEKLAKDPGLFRPDLPAEVDEWARRVTVLGGVTQCRRRVLVALGDVAVQERKVEVMASNRMLREMTGVTSGSVVSAALWWAEQRRILVRVKRPTESLGAVYRIKPIPDRLLAGTPPPVRTRTHDEAEETLPSISSRADEHGSVQSVPGDSASSSLSGIESGPTSPSALPSSPSGPASPSIPPTPQDAGVGAGGAARCDAALEKPLPHGQVGFSMTVPAEEGETGVAEALEPWVIPVNHPAFHRDAMASSAAEVLAVLAVEPMRPCEIIRAVPILSESTIYRALKRLEQEEIIRKAHDGRWTIVSLEPLDRIADEADTFRSAWRRDQVIDMERESFAAEHASEDSDLPPLIVAPPITVETSAAPSLHEAPTPPPGPSTPQGSSGINFRSGKDLFGGVQTITQARVLAGAKRYAADLRRGDTRRANRQAAKEAAALAAADPASPESLPGM